MIKALRNPFNWVAGFRACWVFINPLQILMAGIRRRAPGAVRVRTPTGPVALTLRNFESLKTLFSIFCRQDYWVSRSNSFQFLDIGANIGLASAYFLSRNRENIVQSFEPDLTNLPYLRQNLATFTGRSAISDHAVHVDMRSTLLYRSGDGKHSSLHHTERALIPQQTMIRLFADILAEADAVGLPTIIKVDVEGTEVDLVQSVKFENYPTVQILMVESAECSRWVTRSHRRVFRNGLVEHLYFTM